MRKKKDKYTYLKDDETGFCTIYKNNLYHGGGGPESEAKYLCYALENIDKLELSFSRTNLVFYLDGRELGELKVSQMLAEKVAEKMAKAFKSKFVSEEDKKRAKQLKQDIADIGWEYD